MILEPALTEAPSAGDFTDTSCATATVIRRETDATMLKSFIVQVDVLK